MLFLLNRWKSRPGGATNATTFIGILRSKVSPVADKVHILRVFNDWSVLNGIWFEVADCIPTIKGFLADLDFPEHSEALLLLSKLNFCLGEYHRALVYAVHGNFEIDTAITQYGNEMEYVNKIIETAIDVYKTGNKAKRRVPKEVLRLIDEIVKRNLKSKEFWHVLCLGFECHDMRIIEKALNELLTPNVMKKKDQLMLVQTVEHMMNGSFEKAFRKRVIQLVARNIVTSLNPDFSMLCECYILNDAADDVAEIIVSLLSQGLISPSYQLAFDIHDTASQPFVLRVIQEIKCSKEKLDHSQLATLNSILNGHVSVKMNLDFYMRYHQTDMILLQAMMSTAELSPSRNAFMIAHGLMNYGTTRDEFIGMNLEWVSEATNWVKFNSVASLGVIHYGAESEVLTVLDPYLPKALIEGMGYKEGGAMFAYGLMHARHGDGFVMSALTHWLEMYDQVPILHGACLGFGVAGVGSGSRDGYMTLRKVLLREEPVSGEAAAISMGLILAGHLSNDVFHDLIQYSIETQHDKVQRGIRTGLACAAFGIGENVERYMPETLEEETNPILRSTGVCMLSMAYAGTGNPDAIRRLLDMVATDPNADVKRYAVIGIGFIMSKDVMTCLSYITILIEHYHPHVRYGATMAIAIACAGTGNMYAISLLEPMMSDREGYVRAGAFMAIAMIMGQQSNHTCPKLNSFRMRLMEKMIEEAEDTLVKVGVFIAQGLLDIGGQNASISMHNSEGKSDMAANVGMMCFIHGWYWHSMYYFISLAAKPSSLIILTPDLKMPAITITCHAAFDKFKYPPGFRQREEMPTTEMAHSILSIAVRNNKKEEQKAKQIAKTGVDSSEIPKKESSDAKTVETKPPEEKYHLLDNPTRVIEEQLSFISLTHPFLYKTARPLYKGGIIMATRHEEIKTEEQFIPDFANESSAIKNLSDVAAYRERKAHSTFPIALADY